MIGSFTSWLLIVYVANAQWRICIASSYKSRPYLFTSSYPVDCLTHLLNVCQKRSCIASHTYSSLYYMYMCTCVSNGSYSYLYIKNWGELLRYSVYVDYNMRFTPSSEYCLLFSTIVIDVINYIFCSCICNWILSDTSNCKCNCN